MKSVEVSASPRKEVGKKDSKQLRIDNRVPCVLYGGKDLRHFSIHENDFRKVVYTPEVFRMDIDVEGTKVKAVMQDIQFHPVTDRIIHVDFIELFDDIKVKVDLPVRLNGISKGVLNGGKRRFKLKKLRTLGLHKDFPEFIDIDVTKLRIGQSIKVEDIVINGLEFLDPPNRVIVAIKTARALIEELEEEEEEEEGEEGAEGSEGGDAPAEGGDAPAAE
ncbi:MAG: 50S ribosomal protein L25/general stress protein Ctc [Flavobacteriales bacterium]|nr:50S ribosomal protein L25/general stress protein Ctc [Flavobacteriales bacterium]